MKRIIIITGARKGIGRFLAEHYLTDFIVVGCSRRESDLKHKNYTHFLLDVVNEKDVIKMVRQVLKKFGRIDVLINNAGIAAMNAFLLTPGKLANKVFSTNTMGPFYFMREVSKSMIKNKSGRIVNFTTVAVPLRLEGEAVYAASKAALESLTQIGARELGSYGITVNAVGPTPVATDLIKLIPEEKINILVNRQAIKRLGKFEDVLNTVNFFIDEKNTFITGQTLYLGGING